tara:strand:+ start:908 stop:1489 length:582 start_codon:yes stop_codon:yes gene_type:complete
MARQNISTGTTANDGTGDTLRSAGTKINSNFSEIYTLLGGDANTLTSQISLGADGIIFEGSTDDAFETTLKVTDPTLADKTITFPDATGNVILDTATQTITNKTITVKDIIYDVTNVSGAVTLSTTNAYIKCIGTTYTLTWNEPATTTGELKIFTNTGSGTVSVTVNSGDDFSLTSGSTKMCIADGTNWIQLT